MRSLDGLMERLRSKVAREHAFVHDAAHELRTPMAAISALAHARDAHEREDATTRLDDAIARASSLVEPLLQLARFDGHCGSRAMTDVARVTQEELAMLEPTAFARQLELSLEAPDELHWAIELAAFRAILRNLVGNAIRYVQAGSHIIVGTGGRRRDNAPERHRRAAAANEALEHRFAQCVVDAWPACRGFGLSAAPEPPVLAYFGSSTLSTTWITPFDW